MNQPDEHASTELNPYQSPTEIGFAETQLPASAYAMPPLHWPRTIGVFLVLSFSALATYGTALVFAFPILLGGIRTALIFQRCRQLRRIPPSYLGSTILSPILCFVFQIAAGAAFFYVCMTRSSSMNSTWSEQAWLGVSGVVAFGVFAGLYLLSIIVSVASCRSVSS